MEEARRKLRICLIFVVTLAVLVGCIYYFNDMRSKQKISEGTLVKSQTEEQSRGAGAFCGGVQGGRAWRQTAGQSI